MGLSTVYDVKVRYLYQEGGARAGVSGLRSEIAAASKESSMFGGTLGKLAGLAAGAFGFHELKKSTIDFNSDMEQAKTTIAGMLQMNLGGDWTNNLSTATDLFGKLQQDAKVSIGTTRDMVDMMTRMVQPLTAAGASMEQLRTLTVGMVVAGKSMGFDPTQSSVEMQEILQGNFTARNRFGNALFGPMGFKGEEGRHKLNTMDDAGRLAVVQRALTSTAIAKMRKTQEHSYAGELSTLQDQLQLFLGKVGLPLFERVTAEIRHWNEWIEKNGERLAEIGRDVGGALVTGFEAVKTATMFILEHWKEIALIWASAKVMSGGMSMPGTVMGGLAGFTTKLGLAGVAAGALYVALDSLATAYIDHNAEARARGIVGETSVFKDVDRLTRSHGMGYTEANTLVASMQKDSILSKNGVLDKGMLQGILRDTESDVRQKMFDELKPNIGDSRFAWMNPDTQAHVLADAIGVRFGQVLEEHRELFNPIDLNKAPWLSMMNWKPYEKLGKGGTPQININHIEVQSEDPDRFVARLSESVSSLANNPASAVGALRRM